MTFFNKHRKISDKEKDFSFKKKFRYFQSLLKANDEAHKAMSDLGEMIAFGKPFTKSYANHTFQNLVNNTEKVALNLSLMDNNSSTQLTEKVNELISFCREILTPRLYCPESLECETFNCKTCKKNTSLTEKKYFYSIEQIDDSLFLEVGNKMSRLGEIRNKLNIPVPEGFSITHRIFEIFLSGNNLRIRINDILRNVNFENINEIQNASLEIQQLLISENIPEYLESEILKFYDLVFQEPKKVKLAVRSSAIGEDSEKYSFAGLHFTALNVSRENIIDSAWEVLYSKYSPQSLVYRYINGLRDEDMPMSVACIKMIDAAFAGVIFTKDPNEIYDGIIIQAVRGLGSLLVEGRAKPQEYIVSHDESAEIIHFESGEQNSIDTANILDGVSNKETEFENDKPFLSHSQIKQLVEYTLKIEVHFKTSQDIEWAIDKNNNIYILQARPLNIKRKIIKNDEHSININELDTQYEVLINKGDCASQGIAFGKVYKINNPNDIKNIPNGSIVVARKNLPEFASLIHKVSGYITDTGSTTGHLSIIAREMNIPILTNTSIASKNLQNDDLITLYVEGRRVYKGIVTELQSIVQDFTVQEEPFRDSPLYKIWHRIGQKIFKLHLIDPNSPKFAPQFIETFHDSIRYAHEKAMKIMFSVYENRNFEDAKIYSLKFSVPLDLSVIDLGNGIKSNTDKRWITPEDLNSKPFRALIKGMTTPGIKWSGYIGMDTKGFANLIMGNIIDNNRDRDMGSTSYALISENYINFFSRLGYHFSRLDAYACDEINSNYINFNFRGGASDLSRRTRRAMVVRRILEYLNLYAIRNDDNVIANIRKVPADTIYYLLSEIGRLLGAVRNVDVVMTSDETMDEFIKAFLSGDPAPAITLMQKNG